MPYCKCGKLNDNFPDYLCDDCLKKPLYEKHGEEIAPNVCPECKGRGQIWDEWTVEMGQPTGEWATCRRCRGKGYI